MSNFAPPALQPSQTAVQGTVVQRDDDLVSSGVIQHGGDGFIDLFSQPIGNNIPALFGSGITRSTKPHHGAYTKLTTNMVQNGQLGPLGTAAASRMFLTLEEECHSDAGVPFDYGAGVTEVKQFAYKTFSEILIGTNPIMTNNAFRVPAAGGAHGSVSTTETGTSIGIVSNGMPHIGRKLTTALKLDTKDNLVVRIQTAPKCPLEHSVQTGMGKPYLVWCHLQAEVNREIRG